jgi:phosphonate metabolism protein PhnN/1,5-bisphosphokinase (PRPP-forming)
MSGAWIFICGPSGVGKDSVIASAQQTMRERKDIIFSRRLVTRPAQTGSDHDPVNETDFLGLMSTGRLSWHWKAHGFYYGIALRYTADVQAGRLVVVNGSRAHVHQLAPSATVRVVHITADPVHLAARLKLRGRDADSAVAQRLARNSLFDGLKAECLIANDSSVAVAGQQLADYLTGPDHMR